VIVGVGGGASMSSSLTLLLSGSATQTLVPSEEMP
jgi:hypothetical protein